LGFIAFALDGSFMSSWTPGGGWFSNNRIVYAIVAFLSESIAKCFKHKKVQQKIPQFNSSSAVVFLLLLCVIFVPAILVTCYRGQCVNL
jgi:hypothetical protein